MQDWGPIHGVADIINEMKSTQFNEFRTCEPPDHRLGTRHKPPFGIWFRGQTNSAWTLTPAILRPQQDVFMEETGMFNHFQLRVPEYHQTHRSTFDWLCLMQHYDIPTRLLDWTESVIFALFFAVEDAGTKFEEPHDGRVYVLNARRLNEQTTHSQKEYRGNVCTPDSFDTAARAQLARTRNLKRWKEDMISLSRTRNQSWAFFGIDEAVDEEWLASPVAVIPSRLNGRMVLQSSAFTVHGGKLYPPGTAREEDDLPDPRGLEEFNDGSQFLASFSIPFGSKLPIKRELFELGIHTGSLFPELDKQAEFLKEQWTFDMLRS